MSERIGIQILEADFAAFKNLMPHEVRLGRNYAEWNERRRSEELMATGGVHRVVVRPDEFAAYCTEMRRKPTYFLLESFAVRRSVAEGYPGANSP